MDLTVNYYNQELPNKGDIIFIIMGEPRKDASEKHIIDCQICEYPNVKAMIQEGDLTKKKRIRSIRSHLSTKPVPAEVIDVDDSLVSVSRRFLHESDIKKAFKGFENKKKLLSFLKMISHHTKDSIEVLMKEILYKLYTIIPDSNEIEYLEKHHHDIDYSIFGKYGDIIESTFKNWFKEKPQKIITKFSLISPNGIENTKKVFALMKEEFPKVKPTLVSTATFAFENFGILDEEKTKIDTFLKSLKLKCKENNVSYIEEKKEE